jgi:Fe-S-cluster containining protein
MSSKHSEAEPRAEFGFERSVCACHECTANCKFIPGYLVPADIERISRSLGYSNVVTFALENLAASPGATVMNVEGRVFQIPTLVPQRRADGSCKFLDGQNRCTIHAVSPFGCAFFDAHQSADEANRKSGRGLQEVAGQWIPGCASLYAMLWKLLYSAGHRAIPPQVARRRMEEAAGNGRLQKLGEGMVTENWK